MSPDDYVAAVIRSYELPDGPESPAGRAIEGVVELVKPWAGRCLISTGPAGSWAKGTRIRGSTDLDIVILLGPRTHGTLEKIFHTLFVFLKHKGLSPRQRSVTIAIDYKGLSVDLLPARQEWGSGDKVALFETERGQTVVTDIDKHVQLVRESGRVEDIKALKIWRDLQGLRFPSFYLELIVLDALRHRAHQQPATNLIATLEYLRDRFAGTPFRDPANIENKVSTTMLEHEQLAIATAAGRTLVESDWARIVH